MTLDEIRSLRGQMLATACLFLGCIPLSATVILCRSKLERSMSESYTANYAMFSESQKQLLEQIENSNSQTEDEHSKVQTAILCLLPEHKELIYQDWTIRRDPARPATPGQLVAADEAFFLRRAAQSVVCGDSQQRARALEFIELCASPRNIDCLQRLADWARHRQLREAYAQISAALDRQRIAAENTDPFGPDRIP